MDTTYCEKCGILHDPDDGKCMGCDLISENLMLQEKINRVESVMKTFAKHNQIITAIKIHRALNNSGLREAKLAVENLI